MITINKVHLIGNLTKDVDLRYTKHNTPVASYTIAINSRYGEMQETDYINITTWGKTAEFVAKYFQKGNPIAITGRLKNKNYESNGVKHYSMEVVTEDVEFVGTKKSKEITDHEIIESVIEEEPIEDFMMELTDEDILPF